MASLMFDNSITYSLIVPTYRRPSELFRFLEGISCYFDGHIRESLGFYLEVIVSDDERSAPLQKCLTKLFPWCKYLEGPKRGPASNRNHGAKYAIGEWLVFSDDDCIPQPGWIEGFHEFAHAFEVLEGRVCPYGERQRFDEECPINETGGHLWSCNFAIQRDLYLALGGFNEQFPYAAMEDVEFYERILKSKAKSCFVEKALVLHPWRRLQGITPIIRHAMSEALYARLDPEREKKYFFYSQAVRPFRDTVHKIKESIGLKLYKGLLVSIVLGFAHAACIIYFMQIYRGQKKYATSQNA